MRVDRVVARRGHGDGGHRKLQIVHEQSATGRRRPGERHGDSSAATEARSGVEQQGLARRKGPRRAGRSAGAMEDTGDVAWVGHNIEDVHAWAALAADGDVDGEDAGEEAGPADAARSGGGLGGRVPRVVVIVEAKGELLPGDGATDGGRMRGRR